MLDSSGKIQDGIMMGNVNPIGNFHECIKVETPSLLKWENEYIEGFK